MRSAFLALALLPHSFILPDEPLVPQHTTHVEQPAPRHTLNDKQQAPLHTLTDKQQAPLHTDEPLVPQHTESNWWYVRATVTAYSPHDKIDSGHPSTKDTKTSTMVDWRFNPYGIAADPKAIPYNTSIYVPGYLEKSSPNTAYPVDDTGGRMRRSWRRGVLHIDLRFKTESSAKQWGTKELNVLIDISTMTEAQKNRLRPYKTGEL